MIKRFFRRLEDTFIAISFAEAGEPEKAKKIMAGEAEERTTLSPGQLLEKTLKARGITKERLKYG